MRSANAQEMGYVLAEQRRGFWRIMQKWSTPDLHASVIRYRMEVLAHPKAERFYVVRIRCLNHEIRARAARRTQIAR
jgi:hypothetical protein